MVVKLHGAPISGTIKFSIYKIKVFGSTVNVKKILFPLFIEMNRWVIPYEPGVKIPLRVVFGNCSLNIVSTGVLRLLVSV